MSRHLAAGPDWRLVVDPVACAGIGVCAHLAERVIRPDRWGFPIVAAEPLADGDRRTLRAAGAAVRACPRRALQLHRVDRDQN